MKILAICVLTGFVLTQSGCGQEIRMGSTELGNILRDGAMAKFTLRIVDPDGTVVRNANVGISFAMESSKWISGLSDTDGLFSAEGKSRGEMNVGVKKDGYYATESTIDFGRHEGIIVKDGKWQPWNPTNTVVLRRIKHPIPMYAKEAHFDLPSGNGSFAYDMFVGDLVAPNGVGTSTDLIFHVSTTTTNWRDRIISYLHGDITFPNMNDGIQTLFVPNRVCPQSEYRMPFIAPDAGYSPSLKVANGESETRCREVGYRKADNSTLPKAWFWTDDYHFNDPAPHSWGEEINYFIKVRSQPDGKSCYGLIRGMIRFYYRGTDIPSIDFMYLVNPDGTRNIEYDPSRNLITNFGRYRIYEYSPKYP